MVSTKRQDGSKGENHAAIGGNSKGRSATCGRMWGVKRTTGRQNCWGGQHVSEDSNDQDRELTFWCFDGGCKDNGFPLSEMERNRVLHRS